MIEHIRQYFEDHPQQYLSGEQLSRQFGCSRNAIWKHIQQLRKEGYVFEAIPNKGYQLTYAPAPLSIVRIIKDLTTTRIGKKIHYFHELDSTQTKAHELVESGAQEGELVIAERQTAGRGRMGVSGTPPPAKGIWMSLILTPDLPVNLISQLSLLISLAVCRAMRRVSGADVGIKWPNDLFIRDKKIAGILLESSSEDERLRYCIVGIGMSVNLQMSDFPTDLQTVASSLAIEVGHELSREQLLLACLREIEELYALYLEHGFTPIRTSWEALSISLHRPIRIQQSSHVLEGIAKSIDSSGGLVLQLASGEQTIVYSGIVEHN